MFYTLNYSRRSMASLYLQSAYSVNRKEPLMTKIIFAMYNPETGCVEVILNDEIHVSFNCQKCNASVHLDEPSDIAYLTRLARGVLLGSSTLSIVHSFFFTLRQNISPTVDCVVQYLPLIFLVSSTTILAVPY